MNTENNSWIRSLVTPMPTKQVITRRVKSFDVDMLVNFAVAQNVEGNTTIPLDAIGAPYRLATAKDGTVRFSQAGRPSIRIAKELVSFGTMIHQNIVAGILADTNRVFTEREEEVKTMIEAASKLGAPIVASDVKKLTEAIAARAKAEAEAQAKTEAEAKEAETTTAEADEVNTTIEAKSRKKPARELVGATA